MGGGEVLLSYKVMKNFESKYPCKTIQAGPNTSFGIGKLKLGNDLERTISSLPQDIDSRDKLVFSYYTKIPFSKEDIVRTKVKDMKYAFWDQSVSIRLFPENNTVTGYSITKVTSW